VALAKNVIVSGGTGSGKTTLLNCLSGMIPAGERIIVIEDSSELRLLQDHVLYFEVQAPDRNGRGGISVRDLFRGSLRMRPDRIVVGECRGGEALDMIQAMTSGHSGSLSTCHANTPVDALGRLETMAMMGGVEFPLHALRTQLASAIDLIVQVSRFRDGSRKIESIAEVLDLDEAGRYRLAEIYQFRARGVDAEGKVQGELEWTGRQPRFAEEPFAKGFAERIGLTAGLWRRPAADAPEGSPPVQDQEAR
jgi:pilus assembly protein CpaF